MEISSRTSRKIPSADGNFERQIPPNLYIYPPVQFLPDDSIFAVAPIVRSKIVYMESFVINLHLLHACRFAGERGRGELYPGPAEQGTLKMY
jgi:hypothetical protein